MYGHAGVTKHSLGTGGCNRDERLGVILKWVTDVVEIAIHILVINFQIAEGRSAAGAPVDDALVAVDTTLFVKVYEGGANSLGRPRVQGESKTVPISGNAQTAGLLMDDATGLANVTPNSFQELLTAKVMAAGAFGGQLSLNCPLRRDTGVVGTGQPQGWHSAHPAPANQSVFNGLFQGMAQVQLPGDVGRGHDYHVGLLALYDLGVEIALVLPVLVDALFNVGCVVRTGHLSGSHSRNLSPCRWVMWANGLGEKYCNRP